MSGNRILVVEDEGIIALSVKRTLEDNGYVVPATVARGEEVLATVEKTQPDLILMDILLAGKMTGTEAADQVSEVFDLPIVYLTAHSDTATVNSAKATAPYAYVVKPFEVHTLLATIDVALYKHSIYMRLREREILLDTTLVNIGDAVITTDERGDISFLNPNAEKLLGVRSEAILGRSVDVLDRAVEMLMADSLSDLTRQMINGQRSSLVTLEGVLITRPAKKLPLELTLSAIKAGTGRPHGAVLAIRDITDRKRAETMLREYGQKLEGEVAQRTSALQEANDQLKYEIAERIQTERVLAQSKTEVEREQRRLQAVLEMAAYAIIVTDAKMRLQMINPAGLSLFPQSDLHLFQEIPQENGYEYLAYALAESRESGERVHREIDWPDDRVFSVHVSPIENGGHVTVLHDITHYIEVERLKSRLMATASHDLKNPLASILVSSSLLRRIGDLNPKQETVLTRIEQTGWEMSKLITDLLDLVKVELSTEPPTSLIDIGEIVAEIADEMGPQIAESQHQLEFEMLTKPIWIEGDSTKLKQAIRNLVSNAVKYTPDPGRITLHAGRNGESALVTVEDNGIGIAEAQLLRIFDSFYRVQSPETCDIEGSGLGLAIVKSIIEQHGGSINVASEPGQGSRFVCSFPLAIDEVESSVSQPELAPQLAAG